MNWLGFRLVAAQTLIGLTGGNFLYQAVTACENCAL